MTEPKRRKRLAISCALCRKKKLRCNRETPCSNCIQSRNGACIYETNPLLQSRQTAPLRPRLQEEHHVQLALGSSLQVPIPPTPQSTVSQTSVDLHVLRARVVELEAELSQAKSRGTASPQFVPEGNLTTENVPLRTQLTGPIEILRETRDFGRTYSIARGITHKNRFFGQSHWMNGFVVLQDIIQMLEPQLKRGNTTLLHDVHRAKVLARKIKSYRTPAWPLAPTDELPSREICDGLVDCYLRTSEALYRVVHVPTFRQEYQSLWDGSKKLKEVTMMQLKLILAIGVISYDESCSLRPLAIKWIYEAQTWLSCPQYKAQLGVEYLQASILLLIAREQVDIGGEMCWISAGAVLRIAVYIGLHKDPGQLPRLSTLESEIRRRLWNTILEINLQSSLISGGPSYISLEDFTTQPPCNFDDEQLSSEHAIARADSVYTMSTPAIALRSTFPIRLAIVKFLNDGTSSGTYEETLRIDRQYRAAFKSLRRMLQEHMANIPRYVSEAIDFIMNRYISSLHIPFLNPSLHEATYAFSRKAVFDSSLKIWNLATMATENEPERDLARVCRCGAGFFRAYAFHASSFLAVEFCAQLQDEESTPRPDLINICDEAAKFTLRTIEAGETGIKGYILLHMIAAKVDGIRHGVHQDDIPALLIKGAEEAVRKCLPVLRRIAGEDQEVPLSTEGAADNSLSGVETSVSPDFLKDWDMVMADVFNFEGLYGFDTFLSQ